MIQTGDHPDDLRRALIIEGSVPFELLEARLSHVLGECRLGATILHALAETTKVSNKTILKESYTKKWYLIQMTYIHANIPN